jgi:hypothetical protein
MPRLQTRSPALRNTGSSGISRVARQGSQEGRGFQGDTSLAALLEQASVTLDLRPASSLPAGCSDSSPGLLSVGIFKPSSVWL